MGTESSERTKAKATRSVLYVTCGVFLLGLIVRLWGIQHDFPASYNPDEIHNVKWALRFGSGDLNPHWFHKPAFLYYVLFFEYGLQYLGGRLLGAWSSVDDFAVYYIEQPAAFYLIGRFTVLAFSFGAICGVYRVGERHFGKHVGLVAALLLSLTYAHVVSSQVTKFDVPTACFDIWSVYFLLNYVRDGRLASVILSCVLAGMGAATKYYSIMMLLPVCLAISLQEFRAANSIWEGWRHRLATMLIGVATFVMTFFVCSPYNLLDARGRADTTAPFRWAIGITEELADFPESEQLNESSIQTPGPWSKLTNRLTRYVQLTFSSRGMGPVIASLCVIGTAMILLSRNRSSWLFIVYPILVATGTAFAKENLEPRYQLPAHTFLVVAGGLCVVSVANRSGGRGWLLYGALLLLLCHPFLAIVRHAVDCSRDDTRNVAKRWIEENIPADTKLIVAANGPTLFVNETQIDSHLERLATAAPNGQYTEHYDTFLEYRRIVAQRNTAYEVHELMIPWWLEEFKEMGLRALDSEYDADMSNPLRVMGAESYGYYIDRGFRYAVVTKGGLHGYERYVTLGSPHAERFPSYARFYRQLLERGRLVTSFSPQKNRGVRGPEVRIYELTRESADRGAQARAPQLGASSASKTEPGKPDWSAGKTLRVPHDGDANG